MPRPKKSDSLSTVSNSKRGNNNKGAKTGRIEKASTKKRQQALDNSKGGKKRSGNTGERQYKRKQMTKKVTFQKKSKKDDVPQKRRRHRDEESSSDNSDNDEEVARKRKKSSEKSWANMAFLKDVEALSRAQDYEVRMIKDFVGEDTDMGDSEASTDATRSLTSRNIAAPQGAAKVFMRKTFIRSKSGDCPKIFNAILRMIIKNCAYGTAAVLLAASSSKRKQKGGKDNEARVEGDWSDGKNWEPKRCLTQYLKAAVSHETGLTILDVLDDVYEAGKKKKDHGETDSDK